jgi:N-acetylglucosaminyldiphosphoundecaprenol N-acetyl-beta-D-mannosaminyltransferase
MTTTAAPSPAAAARERRVHVLLGVPIDAVTMDQAVARLLELARTPGTDLVVTPNVDHLILAQRDPEFLAVYRRASMVVADGVPVVWAARFLGKPLPERVAGSDLMPRSVIEAARAGLRYYFVGGPPGDAEKAAAVLAARAGADGLCGIDCPPLGFENDPDYLRALVERINAARPHIVCLALGTPKQEKLMGRLQDRLEAGVLIGVGATLSFVAGTIKRAPNAFQKLGLEWLWRLVHEPRRLWRRYAGNLIAFPRLVLREKLRGRR